MEWEMKEAERCTATSSAIANVLHIRAQTQHMGSRTGKRGLMHLASRPVVRVYFMSVCMTNFGLRQGMDVQPSK